MDFFFILWFMLNLDDNFVFFVGGVIDMSFIVVIVVMEMIFLVMLYYMLFIVINI